MRLLTLILLCCFVAMAAAFPLSGQTIIRTEAGGGPNNIQALSASLPGISAVCSDAGGNVYVASDEMQRVFKIAKSGILTLIAGNTSQSSELTGDGGPANQATLFSPRGLAVDSARNLLYISNQHSVWRVDLAMEGISTYAGDGNPGFTGDGGPATKARISYPEGIALDSNGNLFIADSGNSRVRRVDVATGVITTVAGNGTRGDGGDNGPATGASFQNLKSVAVDPSGTLYIADQYRVRKVVSGTINAFAGTGASGSSGNGGPALSATFGEIWGLAANSSAVYISDFYNHVVRKVALANGIVSAYAGTGDIGSSGDGSAAVNARLGEPWGLAFSPSDSGVLIVDNYSNRIRKVASNGIISTIAGSGDDEQWYGGDNGPATDAMMYSPQTVALYRKTNQLLIGEGGHVRKVDLASQTITTIASDHGFITGLAVDEARGLLYTANVDLCDIKKIDLATNTMSVFAGGDVCGYSGDGGPPEKAYLSHGASGVAVDSNGNVYIADTFNQVIRKVTIGSSPIITTMAGNGTQGYGGDGGKATDANFARPNAVVVDNARSLLYVADTLNHRVRRIDLTASTITTFAGTVDDGYAGDGGPAASAKLNNPKGVALDDSGNVWIADTSNHRIRVVDRQSNIITTAAGSGILGFGGDGGDPTQALLNYPSGITLDASRNYFIADSQNMRVRQVFTSSSNGRVDVLASWSVDGLYQRNSETGEWTRITSSASQIASSSDLTGDGLGDIVGVWSTYTDGGKLWLKSSETGNWISLSGAPGALAVADINGDRKSEVLGVWGSDLWSWTYSNGSGKWDLVFSISSSPDKIAAGDIDGDGKADLVATFSAVSGLWVKYSSTGAWVNLRTVPDQFVCGDLNGDGKADIVGLWGPDIYAYDAASSAWSFIASGANQVAVGDLDGDGKDDIIGVWNYQSGADTGGIYVRYSSSGKWTQLTISQPVPTRIATIRVRGPKVVAPGTMDMSLIARPGDPSIRTVDRQSEIAINAAGAGEEGFRRDSGDPTQAPLNNPSGITPAATRNYYLADTQNTRVQQVFASAGNGRVDILASWAPDGLYQRNSVTGEWTKIAASPSQIASSSDLTGDGLGDIVEIWSTYADGGRLWLKSSEAGNWTALSSSRPGALAVADITGDRKAEILGLWGSDLWSWSYSNGSGKWEFISSISASPDKIAAGDMDGDGKADLVATFSAVSGLWIKYSSTGAWWKLGTTPDQFVCGDLNGDGKADIVGLWGPDVYAYDAASSTWSFIASGSNQVAVGDLDGDGKDDIIGVWNYRNAGDSGGIRVRYSGSGKWEQLTTSKSIPTRIATIRSK